MHGRTTAPAMPHGAEREPGGRRRAHRQDARLDVECVVGRHRYEARTVDVSRDGVLLELTDVRLRPPTEPVRLVELAASLEQRFGNGFVVVFAHGDVSARAALVRVELPRAPAQPFRAGCRFLDSLPAEDGRRLGLTAEGDSRA